MTDPFHASIALAAYAEPLIEGRRVLVFGNATSSLSDHLLERGARLVHVFDPDPGRVAEAATRNTSRNVTFAPLSEGGLSLRDGAFDVAIVENLAALEARPASRPDDGRHEAAPGQHVLRRLARALSPRGAALIATPNDDRQDRLLPSGDTDGGLDYYGLYDAVANHFDHVRMLGQTPFVGYALADFASEGDPTPAIDTAFVPGGAEEPEWFVALAAPADVDLDQFLVVQLPARAVVGRDRHAKLEQILSSSRRAEHLAQERLTRLERENQELREAGRRPPDMVPAAEVARLRNELEEQRVWATQLEARATAADARADDALTRLEELQHDHGAAQGQRAQAQEQERTVARMKEELLRVEASMQKAQKTRDQAVADRDRALKDLDRAHEAKQRAERDRDGSQEELAKVRQDLERALADRDASEAHIAAAERRAEAATSRATDTERKGHRQDRDLDGARRQVEALEASVSELESALGIAQEELDTTRKELDTSRDQLATTREELATARDQLDAARKAASRAPAAPAPAPANPVPQAAPAPDALIALQDEVASLEQRLVERAQTIRELERQLASARTLGRELLFDLEELRSGTEVSELREKLDALAALNAAREGELAAAEWRLKLAAPSAAVR